MNIHFCVSLFLGKAKIKKAVMDCGEKGVMKGAQGRGTPRYISTN